VMLAEIYLPLLIGAIAFIVICIIIALGSG
jgi:hypothetical protein